MKIELKREEAYSVSVIKRVEIEVPDDVEDVNEYIRNYIDSDDEMEDFGNVDGDERWSDVEEIYYESEVGDNFIEITR